VVSAVYCFSLCISYWLPDWEFAFSEQKDLKGSVYWKEDWKLQICLTVSRSCSGQRDVQNLLVRITKPLLCVCVYCYSLMGNNRQNLHILKHYVWRGGFHACCDSIWWWPKWTQHVNDKWMRCVLRVVFAWTINTDFKCFILIQYVLQNFDMSQLDANIFANHSLN
jgi:hypothetical protein